MNSSISTSESTPWWPLLRLYAIGCIVSLGAVATILAMFDPYDTGRFALFGYQGVPAFGQRLTAASLARQPNVEAATIGNSTIQPLDPARLTELTGLHFVSLASPATGPIEQLAIANWLVRHHDGKSGSMLKALVIGIDSRWCRGDGNLEVTNPFPFWLYTDNTLSYVLNLTRLGSFGAVGRKILVIIGHRRPLRADGYREYDSDYGWNTAFDLHHMHMERYELFGSNDFSGAHRLRDFLAEAPTQTLIVLVVLPRYYTSLPTPGSADAEQYDACKAAYRAIAAQRPRTVLLDFLQDDPMLHVDENFLDRAHYLRPVAEKVEDAIAEIVRTAGTSGTGGASERLANNK